MPAEQSCQIIRWLSSGLATLCRRARRGRGGAWPLTLDDFDAVLEMAPDAILAVDQSGTIVLANEQAHTLFGYRRGELAGQPIEMLVPARFREAHAGHRRRYQSAPEVRRMGALTELTAARRDGTEVPVDVSLSYLAGRHGALTLAFIRDTSKTRRLWTELAAAKSELERELHEQRKLRAVSEVLQSLRSRDEVRSVLNQHLEHLFPGTAGAVYLLDAGRETAEALVEWGDHARADNGFSVNACWALRLGKPYGVNRALETIPCRHIETGEDYICVPMIAEGETLGVLHVRASSPGVPAASGSAHPLVLADEQRRRAVTVAERLALPLANLLLREVLREQTIRDSLTGVFNRRYLDEALAREISVATRQHTAIGVAMLDLDHFKRLNDTLGHGAGDDVLRTFGRFLTAQVRESDLVCRYGGEEFVLILPHSSDSDAIARIDEICRRWKADGPPDGAPTTFSGGVAVFPRDGNTGDQIIQAADRALYQAKAAGRDRVVAAGQECEVARTVAASLMP
jgi:diguanylate cyclase (GGDEF)-like protein/PAS domain S-box-containing protein